VYPNEDGTWRVCCWFTGIRTQEEANHISNWLGQLLQQNISPAPPPADSNGAQPPRPDPSVPFAKS